MYRGHRTAVALKLLRPGQHWFGRNGHNQPACGPGGGSRRQADWQEPRARAAGRARSELRQPAIREKLGWEPSRSLRAGLEPTNQWIAAPAARNVMPKTRVASGRWPRQVFRMDFPSRIASSTAAQGGNDVKPTGWVSRISQLKTHQLKNTWLEWNPSMSKPNLPLCK